LLLDNVKLDVDPNSDGNACGAHPHPSLLLPLLLLLLIIIIIVIIIIKSKTITITNIPGCIVRLNASAHLDLEISVKSIVAITQNPKILLLSCPCSPQGGEPAGGGVHAAG
jgi:hypothetical protein